MADIALECALTTQGDVVKEFNIMPCEARRTSGYECCGVLMLMLLLCYVYCSRCCCCCGILDFFVISSKTGFSGSSTTP